MSFSSYPGRWPCRVEPCAGTAVLPAALAPPAPAHIWGTCCAGAGLDSPPHPRPAPYHNPPGLQASCPPTTTSTCSPRAWRCCRPPTACSTPRCTPSCRRRRAQAVHANGLQLSAALRCLQPSLTGPSPPQCLLFAAERAELAARSRRLLPGRQRPAVDRRHRRAWAQQRHRCAGGLLLVAQHSPALAAVNCHVRLRPTAPPTLHESLTI